MVLSPGDAAGLGNFGAPTPEPTPETSAPLELPPEIEGGLSIELPSSKPPESDETLVLSPGEIEKFSQPSGEPQPAVDPDSTAGQADRLVDSIMPDLMGGGASDDESVNLIDPTKPSES